MPSPAHGDSSNRIPAQAPIDHERLLQRVVHHAQLCGASAAAAEQIRHLLGSSLGRRVLALPAASLSSLLVNDLYKIRMQNMYSQFMTGVHAEFVLNIRHCVGAERTVLATIRQQQPDVFRALTRRVCCELQQLQPIDERVAAALLEFDNFTAPQALQDRLAAAGGGVAPVSWVELETGPSLLASGPVEAASNTETSCMQAVQEAIVVAGAASLAASHPGLCLDRTERLAASLGRMAAVVEAINGLRHDADIMLMAGRRSTDLLHLLFQNLYFMQYARNYAGTSSVLAVAVLLPLLAAEGLDRQQRRALVKRLLGTHAHEMTSLVQHLLVGWDEEAGRRCCLKEPVCVTQLLSHLLFLVANGGLSSSTALPDTFTTPYFVRLAAMTKVPPEFIADMQQRWQESVASGSSVFDLFRVWRLDSGNYAELAALLHLTWRERCQVRQSAGLPELPPPRLINSNISSVQDIQQLTELPPHLQPSVLGFGGLADGFAPFPLPGSTQQQQQQQQPAAQQQQQHHPAPQQPSSLPGSQRPPCGSPEPELSSVRLTICSLVMKAVQASLPAATSGDSGGSTGCLAPAGPDNSEGHQPCAVKVGDGSISDKAQTDPRLPLATRSLVLRRMGAMVAAAQQLSAGEHASTLSQVLREAYNDVVDKGVLNKQPCPGVHVAGGLLRETWNRC